MPGSSIPLRVDAVLLISTGRVLLSRCPVKTYFVYIMSNNSRRLYVGFSSDLSARVFKHKNKCFEDSFTAHYRFDMLV
jgi:GIY-YIG catalytic domain-containing protein